MDEAVEQFVSFTAASDPVARGFLEMSGGDVMQAVQLFYEHPDLQSSLDAASSLPVSCPQTAAAAGGSETSQNRPITVDSDSDRDIDVAGSDDLNAGDHDHHSEIVAIRRAQEEEDARLAREMQEDLYKQSSADGQGVRAPIARTTETLVAPSYGGSSHVAYGDDDEEIDRRMAEMERRRRQLEQLQRARQPRGPFSQSIWDEPVAASGSTRSGNTTRAEPSRSQRLAELFRPPHDLMCYLGWDDAREEGKEQKKWLLVDLQDPSLFDCQTLNRDIWKDEDIKALVRENFIFIQYTTGESRADQYKTFYFHGQSYEDPSNYPHVSIVDPRTGEQVKVFSGRPFPSAREFHAALVEFLDRYSLDPNSKNPVVTSRPPAKPRNLDAMTEEEMLEMALRESMAGNSNVNGSSNPPAAGGSGTGVHDPDALTRGIDNTEASSPAEQSIFKSISSSSPHVEPPQDPESTTRIQFRHPTGRIIRRFGMDEQVRRIYEWLKAEPLKGKEGLEFELKTSPQGRNLIDMLDETVAGAGLKQGTVMIEFIED